MTWPEPVSPAVPRALDAKALRASLRGIKIVAVVMAVPAAIGLLPALLSAFDRDWIFFTISMVWVSAWLVACSRMLRRGACVRRVWRNGQLAEVVVTRSDTAWSDVRGTGYAIELEVDGRVARCLSPKPLAPGARYQALLEGSWSIVVLHDRNDLLLVRSVPA